MDRTCPNCRTLVTEGASACPACGHALAQTKRKLPIWLWVVIGIGCCCPLGILVMGLVVSVFLPRVHDQLLGAQRAKTRADVEQIVSALNEYAIRNGGEYPETLEALVAPDGNGMTFLNAPAIPRDPWKQPYEYEPPAPGSGETDPHVWSNGPDGLPDGEDDVDSRTMNDD